MVLRKTRRNIGTILVLGTGLSVGTAVESRLSPPVPVFTQFAPVVAPVGTLIGANILLRQVKKLPEASKPRTRRRLL